MNVAELIEALEQFDPDLEVFTSQDNEGNGFSPIVAPGIALMVDEDVVDPDDVDEDDPDVSKVVMIWPV